MKPRFLFLPLMALFFQTLQAQSPCNKGTPVDLFPSLTNTVNGKMRFVRTGGSDTLKIFYRATDTDGSLTMLVETDIGGDDDDKRDPDEPERHVDPENPLQKILLPADELSANATEECQIAEPIQFCRHQLDKNLITELIKCGNTLTLVHDGQCLCRIELRKDCEICIDFGEMDARTYDIIFMAPRDCLPAVELRCP